MSFSMASGFFLGLIFAVLNFDAPLDIIMVTLMVNFLFFGMVVFGLSLFMRTNTKTSTLFHRKELEENAVSLANKINSYEAKIEKEIEALNKVRQTVE